VFKCRASAILADWTSVHVDAIDATVEDAMNDAADQLLKTLWGVFDR
jgi:hypothetical protein